MPEEHEIKSSELLKAALHSLNNSLFVVSGKLELLLDEDLSPEIKEKLKVISAQVEKMRLQLNEIPK